MFEFFLDLSLEIIEATDELGEMLEAFSRPDKLDVKNQYKCSHCSKPSRARKQITVYQQPNVLMIQLKRFRTGTMGKVNKYIRFPLELSLRKYMSGCKLKEEAAVLKESGPGSSDLSTVYRLHAVIVHLDLMNISSFGHYICYIRDVNHKEDWLRFDDETITKVNVKEVLQQRAYILFYQRSVPSVSSEKVATEEPVAVASPVSADPSLPSSSPSLSPSSFLTIPPVSSASPPPAATAAAEGPVQCIGGCDFWERPPPTTCARSASASTRKTRG
jgi:ubiquitin carboxyl-terminal hydrolase 36/42